LCHRLSRLPSPLTVLIDSWRVEPLVFLHRAEAKAIVAELRAAGRAVSVEIFDRDRLPEATAILLRLSDPVMLDAARALEAAAIAYRGPGAAALERCYDKWRAYGTVAAVGVDCPDTRMAADADALRHPIVLKPRRGSDSIGLRVLRTGSVPSTLKNETMLVQAQIFGAELTVAVIDGIAGDPLRLELPEGAPYTFLRKYLWRPRHAPVTDRELAARVRNAALAAARSLGVDWGARIDFMAGCRAPSSSRGCSPRSNAAARTARRPRRTRSLPTRPCAKR